MEITIIGAGAIGGVLGAYLAKEGEQVVLCDVVTDHVEKIRTDGLHIDGPDEILQIKIDAYTPSELVSRNKPIEMVFVCVKAHHAQEAIDQVSSLLTEESIVISFQNGLVDLEMPSDLKTVKPICCFVNFSADYLKPGRILYGGVSTLSIGEFDGTLSERLLLLKKILMKWGPVTCTQNIKGFLWSKLSYASLLYATALVDETMAVVTRKIELRPALIELCAEVLEVAHKSNVELESFDTWRPELMYPRENQKPEKLNENFNRLSEWMSKNKKQKSGIWRDLAVRKRNTEVDFDLTPIVQLGKKFGLELPLTSYIIRCIKDLEDGKKVMGWENLNDFSFIFQKGKKLHE